MPGLPFWAADGDIDAGRVVHQGLTLGFWQARSRD